jgi:fatty-acyl-CoA synthase
VHPYGASEAGIISVLAGPDYDVSRPELLGTAGRPLPGVEVLIETADGPAVERGAEGAIAVRSPAVADGYTAVVADSGFRDGRYYVGDLGFIDGDGYLHVRGRIRDALWVEGRSVLPVDIQDVLCRRADVRYAVAVPDGDPAHGYGVAIAAAARSTLTAAQAAELLETEIGIRPWAVAFVDRMPVTEQGKPDRRALAALFAAADRLDS